MSNWMENLSYSSRIWLRALVVMVLTIGPIWVGLMFETMKARR